MFTRMLVNGGRLAAHPALGLRPGMNRADLPPANPAAALLYYLLALLLLWYCCLVVVRTMRGEMDTNILLLVPVEEVLLTVFTVPIIGVPGVLSFIVLVYLVRRLEPLRRRSAQRTGEVRARAMIQAKPRDVAGYERLSSILRDSGRPGEAADVLARWVQVEPDSPVIRRKMEILKAQAEQSRRP